MALLGAGGEVSEGSPNVSGVIWDGSQSGHRCVQAQGLVCDQEGAARAARAMDGG